MARRVVTVRRNILRARNYKFSRKEMMLFQILGVYNSVSRAEDMNNDYVNTFVRMHFDPGCGEIALSEKYFFNEGDVEMCVLSVVVFVSLFGMQLYMIKFKKEYLGIAKDKSFNGMFN